MFVKEALHPRPLLCLDNDHFSSTQGHMVGCLTGGGLLISPCPQDADEHVFGRKDLVIGASTAKIYEDFDSDVRLSVQLLKLVQKGETRVSRPKNLPSKFLSDEN